MHDSRSFNVRSLRLAPGILLALLLLALPARPALAAAPSNDTIGGATPVTVPFSETLDTTEATTDADDAQVNFNCGAPATDASVWYTLVGDGQSVIVDVSQSSYFAGVIVATGTPGSLNLVTCGPDGVAFTAEAGTTYYVLAFDDQTDGGANGGSLSISFSAAPPPPEVSITADPRGKFNAKTGVATISGTYTCTNSDFIDISVEARQKAGRFTVVGYGFYSDAMCDGAPHAWTVDVAADGSKFAGGKALALSFAFSCGVFQCSDGYAEQTVILQGKK